MDFSLSGFWIFIPVDHPDDKLLNGDGTFKTSTPTRARTPQGFYFSFKTKRVLEQVSACQSSAAIFERKEESQGFRWSPT